MYRTAVLTVSDAGHRGEREDKSGEVIAEIAAAAGFAVAIRALVPDEREIIEAELIRLCDVEKAVLVLTTGGTGFSPRDVTPEATLAVVDKPCPGIPEAMRAYSLTKTKKAMLSRAAAGIRGGSLIVNLPGSPKAVRECLEYIIDVLPHGLDVLGGDVRNCAEAIHGS